jgi:hypothetical protein
MPGKRVSPSRPSVTMALVVGLVVLVSVSACRLFARDRASPTLAATATAVHTATSTWTSTATWTPVPNETPTHTPTAASTPVPTETPTLGPTQTPTLTSTSMPSPTQTATSTPTSTPVPTVTPTFTPTPIVCNDIAMLTWIEIAPGQRFECTTHQDTIVEQMKSVEQVPCEEVSVVFEDGRFSFTCKSRVNVTVKGSIAAHECELKVDIEGGLVGGGLMEVLIRTLLKNLPYDKICIEEAELTDGKFRVRGYGR